MAYRSNAERMKIMHSMCKRELELLQANLTKFLLESEAIMANDIFSSFRKDANLHPSNRHVPNVFTLLAYDRYMSRVAAATNLARKFNIHLQLHNLNTILTADVSMDISPGSYLLEEFVEWHKILKEDHDECFDHISDWKSLRSAEEESSVAISLADTNQRKTYTTDKLVEDGNYPNVRKITFATPESLTLDMWPSCVQLLNLSAFVGGHHFAAFITYIDDAVALSFYVCQMRNDMLYELSNMLNLPKSVRMPPSNVVFGISINSKSILRGVLHSDDSNNDDDNLQVLLIDYGELVPLDCNDVQFYDLPKVYRDLPAQSIKCILLGIKKTIDDNVETDSNCLRNKLRNYEFKEVNFEVARKAGRVLYVYIIENKEAERTKDRVYKRINASTNPFVNSFDENAGDDNEPQRVKFGSNNDLKFLSRPRIDDVFKNDIIQLEVMHIAEPNCFYAQILREKTEQLQQLFWNTEEIALEQKLNESPELGDLILAQYAKDEFWYRAKVIGINDESIYKVFYVDYGNTEMVPLKSLAKCNNIQEMEPFRAVQCRFAGISDTTADDEFRFKQAVQMLVVMLLNQRIKVQVVEKINDELSVQLLDKEFAETTQMMVNLGYAEEIIEII